jgi:sulfate permease, SulP family
MGLRRNPIPGAVRRLFPFLGWPRFTAATVRADLIAGLTVSLVAIPQSLAYAQLAGVPAYYGLYAAFIPSIIGPLFGSSALLSTGPVAMTSLLTAASVTALHPQGPDQFYAYVTLLALLSGLFQLGLGLARAGVLLNLVSHPVLMGFINAAALIIALSQLPALMGISTRQTEHLLLDTWNVVSRMDLLHEMSLALGLAAIVLLLALKRFAPKLPGVLITVGLLTLASYAAGFADRGGRVVGAVPTGLPGFVAPQLGWEAIKALLPAALVVAVISFMEAMSSCKVIALKTRTPWSENQELIGQGLAKIAAAFCQSMPVSGSFSRSALNLACNARTGLCSLGAAAAVLVTLLFFTPYLYHLPKPVLAAIIMLAVFNLIDVSALRRAWLASKEDGFAGTATFVATLAFAPNIQNGILTGIIISLGAFIYGRMRPRIAVVSMHPDGMLRDVQRNKLPPLHPQIGALRFDASLYFANASFFEDAVLQLASENGDIRFILIAAQGINHLDASGVEMLRNLSERLRQSGVTLVLGGVKQQVLDVMQRTGLTTAMGENNVFVTDKVAVESLMERTDRTTAQQSIGPSCLRRDRGASG